MADYYSIITNRGKELEAEALASGRLIVLTHFVVGDSNGKQVKPDPAQIRLINETFRGDIAELVVSPEQSTQLMAKIVLPTGVGGFTVREVGLMTDAGELYAVANCPSIDKPVGGVSVNMQFRLAVSDTSNITLNVATGDGLFLRIDQNLKEIKARGAEAQKTSRESIGVLDGTTQRKGLVQLNSAVNNTSETQAATPYAVKIAMDNANARLAKDRNGGDIPNVALFLQNLGLVETINRAANALQITDVTTSATDKTAGRLPAVGWMGNGISIVLPENCNLNDYVGMVATFSTINPGASAKNFPVNSGGVLRVSQGSDNRTIQEYTTFNPVVKYVRALYSVNTWSDWDPLYSVNNPPPEAYPVGSPIPWPSDTIPAGYARMQGLNFNKSSYPLLAIAYPSGIIPDMRGQTIKGKPDSGRAVLSQELDGIKSHSHSASAANTDLGTKATTSFDYGTKTSSSFDYGTKTTSNAGAHSHRTKIAYGGGGSTTVTANAGATSSWATDTIESAGAHTHTVGIGAHTHTVGIGAHIHNVVLGSHNHAITVNAAGNTENTVKNTAFNYLVRLA